VLHPTNERDYHERGAAYARAWAVMVADCDYPPSIEVFDKELAEQRRATPTLTVEQLARQLAERYRRVRGFYDEYDR
jgi:hypothetical protein